MAAINCEQCAWRAKYDNNPKSLLGKLWLWHTKICPGWKMYLQSLDQEMREKMYTKYGYRKV